MKETPENFRLAVAAPLPVQYNSPFFSRLAREPGIELTVLYGTLAHTYESFDEGFGISYSWDIPLLEGYSYKKVPTLRRTEKDHGWELISPHLLSELKPSRYDAVLIYGWGDWFSRCAILSCILNGVPFFVTGDATPIFPESPVRGALKHLLLAWLLRRADACLYFGSLQRVFYERLGVPEDRLIHHPYAVDNDRFFEASTTDPAKKNKLRADLGLPPDIPLVAFCGKFIKRKRPLDLLEAMAELQKKGVECGAVFIGEGELRPLLDSMVTRLELQDIYFPGFVNQSLLPQMLAACDVLVLPSEKDPRATVVAEAMASGLPVVISHRVGLWGFGDIVVEEKTGFVYRCGDVEGLASTLEKLLVDGGLRVRMARAALEKMKTWGMEERVKGVTDAIRALAARRSA